LSNIKDTSIGKGSMFIINIIKLFAHERQ